MTRILLVDDEEVFLKSLVEGLQELEPEWQIESTTRGEEALRWLAERGYDVAVIDLRMPGVDGFSILAELSEREPSPIVIVMSAYLSPGAKQSLREAFVDRVLEKPFDLEELREAVKACVEDDTRGMLEGISLPTILQLLEMEQRTCTLEVNAGDKTGFVYFRGGTALDARVGDLFGDAALFELLTWSRPRLRITSFCPVRKQGLSGSITSLLLEAAKAADELDLPPVGETLSFEGTAPPMPPALERLLEHAREALTKLFAKHELPLGLVLAHPGEVLLHWPPEVAVPGRETVAALLRLVPDLEAALPGGAAPVALSHVEAERGHILAARVALPPENQPFPESVTLILLAPPASQIPLLREKLYRLCHGWVTEGERGLPTPASFSAAAPG